MSRRFKVWLDSGANAESCFKDMVSLNDLNISSEEWDAMTEDDRDRQMREVAWGRSDWGYSEIEDGS